MFVHPCSHVMFSLQTKKWSDPDNVFDSLITLSGATQVALCISLIYLQDRFKITLFSKQIV